MTRTQGLDEPTHRRCASGLLFHYCLAGNFGQGMARAARSIEATLAKQRALLRYEAEPLTVTRDHIRNLIISGSKISRMYSLIAIIANAVCASTKVRK
jgi:hypothetical protein